MCLGDFREVGVLEHEPATLIFPAADAFAYILMSAVAIVVDDVGMVKRLGHFLWCAAYGWWKREMVAFF
jgi:hypothetical protein